MLFFSFHPLLSARGYFCPHTRAFAFGWTSAQFELLVQFPFMPNPAPWPSPLYEGALCMFVCACLCVCVCVCVAFCCKYWSSWHSFKSSLPFRILKFFTEMFVILPTTPQLTKTWLNTFFKLQRWGDGRDASVGMKFMSVKGWAASVDDCCHWMNLHTSQSYEVIFKWAYTGKHTSLVTEL